VPKLKIALIIKVAFHFGLLTKEKNRVSQHFRLQPQPGETVSNVTKYNNPNLKTTLGLFKEKITR
jgi:hypothetical protein